MFDASRPIAVKLLTEAGPKTISVRFPTDEEWIERQRKRKLMIKQLGRGMSETVVPDSHEIDAALFAKIRLDADDGPPVDPYEASRIIEQLSQADVDDVQPEAGGFRVSLRILGGTTVHILRMPSAKDVLEYRRGFARVVDLPFNRQELTINLAPAAALYKKLVQSTEGYAGDVPIIHQVVAVRAAIDALDAALHAEADPNF